MHGFTLGRVWGAELRQSTMRGGRAMIYLPPTREVNCMLYVDAGEQLVPDQSHTRHSHTHSRLLHSRGTAVVSPRDAASGVRGREMTLKGLLLGALGLQRRK
jgi:hypothetical protein